MPEERDNEESKQAGGEAAGDEVEDEPKRVKTAAEVASERAAQAGEEAAPEDEPTEPPPQPEEAEDAPQPERPEDALPPVTVPDLLKSFCGMLLGQAWQKLGLLVDPTTGELVEDHAQARLAIDALAVLLEKLEGHLSEEEKRDLDAAVANLRINYVQRTASAEPQQGEGEEADN